DLPQEIKVVTHSHGTQTVEAHEAYVEVAAADVVSDGGWPFTTDDTGARRWYPIDRPELALAGLSGDFVEPAEWRESIPSIKATCPTFEPPAKPAKGTVLDLHSGTLAAAKPPGSDARITTLTAKVSGEAIRLVASGHGATRTLTLRKETPRIAFTHRFK